MLVICLQIFMARIVDVSLGTLRTIFIVRGKKRIASIIAFFEVFIWFLVAKEALDNINQSILIPIFYSAGFAVGTYIGINITNKYLKSFVNANVVTKKDNRKLVDTLRNAGYGVSVVALKNEVNDKKKDLLLITLNNKSIDKLTKIINEIDEKAFVNFSEIKHIQNGIIK